MSARGHRHGAGAAGAFTKFAHATYRPVSLFLGSLQERQRSVG